MRRATLNLLIDVVSFGVLATIIATGTLIRFILPPGSRGGRGLAFCDLDRHEWGDIHFWLAVSLMSLMLVHLMLHWTWVCQIARAVYGRTGSPHPSNLVARRTVIGATLLTCCIGLIAGFLFIASSQVSYARGSGVESDDFQRSPIVERRADEERPSQELQHRRGSRGNRQR